MAPFVAPIASYVRDDGLRPEILKALCRIAEAAPEQIKPMRETLQRFGNMSNPEERPLLERLLAGDAEESE